MLRLYAYCQPILGNVNKTYDFQYVFTNNLGIMSGTESESESGAESDTIFFFWINKYIKKILFNSNFVFILWLFLKTIDF